MLYLFWKDSILRILHFLLLSINQKACILKSLFLIISTPFIKAGIFLFFISGLSESFSHLKNLFKIKCLLFHVPIHLCSGSDSSSFLNLFKYDNTSTFVI